MVAMPRPRPPYLSREITRHGAAVWYVRRNGNRTRIRAEYGTPEFDAEYQAALTACQPPAEKRLAAGTLTWLIECFRGTAAWQARSESTRAKWDGIYRQVMETAGSAPLSAMTPKAIRSGLERRAHTPGQAQHFLNAMRALFRWAVRVQLVKTDPLRASKRLLADAMPVSALGLRRTLPRTRSNGRSERASASGSTCCSIPGSGAAMQCGWGANMSATASRPSRRRRLVRSLRSRSCPCWLRHCSRTVRRPRVHLWCSRPANGQDELRQ